MRRSRRYVPSQRLGDFFQIDTLGRFSDGLEIGLDFFQKSSLVLSLWEMQGRGKEKNSDTDIGFENCKGRETYGREEKTV
mmetsp:Transcript_55648/g.134892  ORF Transcript_55648/g.134892 Transcript_55648/m.134892 type:complete len:80 (-) Transcript_55648:224-463(-)